jgi:hypothetical protein
MNSDELMEDLRWVSAPSPGSPFLWLTIMGFLLLASLAVGIWWFLLRRRAGQNERPAIPPHVTALEELARLRAAMNAENSLDFIVEVSRILRVYIQGRFGLRAPHRSTEEFLLEATESPQLSPDRQELLGDFLRQCDLVKFARRQAALDRMNGLLETATRFVQDTIPAPLPPAAASAS